jgi:hypothetical protein
MLSIFTIHVVLTIILHGVLYETESSIHNISETPHEMGQYILLFRVEVMTFVVFPQRGGSGDGAPLFGGVLVSTRYYLLLSSFFPKMYLLTCYHRLPEKSIKSGDILFIFVIINHRQHQKHRKRYYLFSIFFNNEQ